MSFQISYEAVRGKLLILRLICTSTMSIAKVRLTIVQDRRKRVAGWREQQQRVETHFRRSRL